MTRAPRAGRGAARARARALRAGSPSLGRARPAGLGIAPLRRAHALDDALAGRISRLRARGAGARFRDVDGIEYVDFCLGDTGAMTGHSPEPVVRAVAEQAARGITLMLPSEEALWVGEELTRRFGLPRWQFALTATDANRFAIRLARHVTGRPKVLVFNWCYHGTVDESFATLRDGRVVEREGNLGAAGPARRDDAGGRVERRRGAAERARATATSRASSPSRRSRTSASCSRSPASTRRCAS